MRERVMQNIVTLNQNDLWTMLADLSAGHSVRIHADEYGVMWSVDHGMWTVPVGEVKREVSWDEPLTLQDDDTEWPFVLGPCDHKGTDKVALSEFVGVCHGCGEECDL
jgi:hypothetical protein